MSIFGDAADWVGDAAEDAADWVGEAAEDTGDWVEQAAEDAQSDLEDSWDTIKNSKVWSDIQAGWDKAGPFGAVGGLAYGVFDQWGEDNPDWEPPWAAGERAWQESQKKASTRPTFTRTKPLASPVTRLHVSAVAGAPTLGPSTAPPSAFLRASAPLSPRQVATSKPGSGSWALPLLLAGLAAFTLLPIMKGRK